MIGWCSKSILDTRIYTNLKTVEIESVGVGIGSGGAPARFLQRVFDLIVHVGAGHVGQQRNERVADHDGAGRRAVFHPQHQVVA